MSQSTKAVAAIAGKHVGLRVAARTRTQSELRQPDGGRLGLLGPIKRRDHHYVQRTIGEQHMGK